MKKKWIALITSALSLFALSACGGGETAVGTWYVEEDDAIVLVLEDGGRALMHDFDFDETIIGTWSGTDGAYVLSYNGEDLELTARGEDTLVLDGGSLVRGEDIEVPLITYTTLYDYYWYAEDGSELCFYSDESWDICDANWDTLEEGRENSVTIDGDEITLTTRGGDELTLKLSADGTELHCSNEMIFVKEY